MTLTALPARYVPPGHGIHDMALSPDGTQLAADIGSDPSFDDKLYIFDLATGTERAWSVRTCAKCVPGSGGLVYAGVNTDALSWTADSQEVAFIWGNTVRLLDTRAAGSGILTGSKTVATWTDGAKPLTRGAGPSPPRTAGPCSASRSSKARNRTARSASSWRPGPRPPASRPPS